MAKRVNVSVSAFIKSAFAAKAHEDADTLFIEVVTDTPLLGEDGLPKLNDKDEPLFETKQEECSAIEWIANDTGMGEKTVEQKLTHYRNPEFKMEEYEDEDGNPVYLTGVKEEYETKSGETKTRYVRNEDNTAGTTIFEDEARKDDEGELIRATRKALDADGNPIISRPAIPLPTFKRGGGGRSGLADQVDDAIKLIAELTGRTVEEVLAEQEANNAKALERATAS